MWADCVLWTGGVNKFSGYGSKDLRRRVKGTRVGRVVAAHVWVWEQAFGPVPDGMDVLHACSTRLCVNLAHLSVGTRSENIRQSVVEGTLNTVKLTVDQVHAIRSEYQRRRPGVRGNGPELAARYGVSTAAIYKAAHNETWSWV